MERKANGELVPRAKQLRKTMTKEERRLWYEFLRGYPIRFYRQKVLSKYIADFYCAKAKLIIELDGSQHFLAEGMTQDENRTRFLENYGLLVVRIANNDVSSNFSGVCEFIDRLVKERLQEDTTLPSAKG